MQLSNNTILITGGGSGIGEGLAVALHEKGNNIIVAGRRAEPLERLAANYSNMTFMTLDIRDSNNIKTFSHQIKQRFPELNVLINNAGVMLAEDLTEEPINIAKAEDTILTNLLGPIRLTAELLSQLKRQQQATVIMVSSGLAFVPRCDTPTYCATKAAIHSYAQSLRHQLRNTSVSVLEIAPPAVATDLMPGHRINPRCMPLSEYINETVELMEKASDEILVERVRPLHDTLNTTEYKKIFAMLNG